MRSKIYMQFVNDSVLWNSQRTIGLNRRLGRLLYLPGSAFSGTLFFHIYIYILNCYLCVFYTYIHIKVTWNLNFQAQNIKNFKSQRWQCLLNFNSMRRLLLTGTPLQNSLMELWSLMHFLMPHVFQSHKDFKEWFANPLTGMIEGSHEYNESLIRRLHKVWCIFSSP